MQATWRLASFVFCLLLAVAAATFGAAHAQNRIAPVRCDWIEARVGDERRCLKPKDSFTDCPGCPEMVVVPSGTFIMGSRADDRDRFDNEGPSRKVTIAKPFAVGRYEVTFAEWDSCASAGGCKYRPSDNGWGRDKRPVMRVSWDDITKDYLPWLVRKTGKSYRLLTEAEWEYAARAGSITRFYFGSNEKDLCDYANVADRIGKEIYADWIIADCRDGYVNTAPVGSFKPNAFGLYDMHGNVLEWVQDCWNGTYSGAPSDGAAWVKGECGTRVLRGGSWAREPRYQRLTTRNKYQTGTRSFSIGFRVARTL
jgi:formylglycine-generating enzyme required for sulfatase activity